MHGCQILDYLSYLTAAFRLAAYSTSGDTHIIKTIKSKYGADLLLVCMSMIGLPLALNPWRTYFFVTFFNEPSLGRNPGFSPDDLLIDP